jgi:hypothetical protein
MGVAYNPRIVTNGLVLALDAGNAKSYPGSGTTWTDLSGKGNHSTLTNGPTYDSSNGGGIVFDGSNDYATTTTTPTELLGNPNITVSGWFRRLGNMPTNTGTWGLGGNITNQGICSWWYDNNNQITIDTWGEATFTTSVEYPLNQWVYVTWQKVSGAMTRSNCTIWVNLQSYTGTQLTILRAENQAPNINNNGVTLARIFPTYGTPVNIQISAFTIYNRILTPLEIKQNFNATRGRYGV